MSKRRKRDPLIDPALTVACHICGARVGEPCRNLAGHWVRTHQVRIETMKASQGHRYRPKTGKGHRPVTVRQMTDEERARVLANIRRDHP